MALEEKMQRYSYYVPDSVDQSPEPEDKTIYYLCSDCNNWTLKTGK